MSEKSYSSELGVALREFDAHYIPRWMHEGSLLHESGAHASAVEMVDPKPGCIHLDIGTAAMMLPILLKDQCPQMTVIGIDRNDFWVDVIAVMNETGDYPHVKAICSTQDIVNTGSLVVTRKYEMDEEMRRANIDYFDPDGSLTFICDDIRTREVLNEILGDRQVDSVSFLFPGVTNRVIYEEPYRIERVDVEETKRRVNAAMSEVRSAAYDYASRVVRTGGKFVMAERVFIPDKNIENCIRNIMYRMGPSARYWTPIDASYLHSPDNVVGGMNSGQYCYDNDQDITVEDMTVVLASFERNDVPYSE